MQPPRVAVFTAIFSEKVPIDKPGIFTKIHASWDYILYTNLDPEVFEPTTWKVVKVPLPPNTVIPYVNDGAKYIYANRWYKWHPYVHMRTYDAIIYVDGFQVPDVRFAEIWTSLVNLVSLTTSSVGLIQAPHHKNTCIYQELQDIVGCKKDSAIKMAGVEKFLRSVQYPENLGLLWNGCYVVNVANESVHKVWQHLWRDMIKLTYRDQSLMMYELWLHAKEMEGVLQKFPLDHCVRALDTNTNHVYA